MGLDLLEQSIDPETLAELRALALVPGRPLLLVDADEVLVALSEHIARFLVPLGYEMRLTQYRLEGTIFPAGSDRPLAFDECLTLIDRFFRHETLAQQAIPGAVAALGALAEIAQIVVLTNVPRFARADRIANLTGLGLPYPVVVNAGGKGRAVAWLAARAKAPVAFVDDSATQIASVAKHAPATLRLHFAGAEYVRRVIGPCPEASHRVESWEECAALIRAGFRA